MNALLNILTAIAVIASHAIFCAMIINLSNNPALGWFLLIAPYVVLVATVIILFIQSLREYHAERNAAARMGQPYEKAYANETATHSINAQNA